MSENIALASPTAYAGTALSPTYIMMISMGIKVIKAIACMRCTTISLRNADLSRLNPL
jgi:hypothetical protein